MSNGEESSGIGSLDVGEFVVVEETADKFVDDETADDLNPHRCFFFLLIFGNWRNREKRRFLEIKKKKNPS